MGVHGVDTSLLSFKASTWCIFADCIATQKQQLTAFSSIFFGIKMTASVLTLLSNTILHWAGTDAISLTGSFL